MTEQLPRPISSDWLELRRGADHAAREGSNGLLAALTGHLASRREAGVDVVDVGAGTGSNLAWLAPRLGADQHWTLLDHDARLLAEAVPPPVPQTRITIEVRTAEIGDLGRVLEAVRTQRPLLVTCSALLDLLTADQIHALCEAAVDARAACLFSLSVTGEASVRPARQDDDLLHRAFAAHQRRAGLAGAHGAAIAADTLSAAGFLVSTADTSWRLDAGQHRLVNRFLADRVAAAIEQEPGLQAVALPWLAERQQQLQSGRLDVTVGHRDVLALPQP